jgi:flagellar motor switch protein FliN/FliY
LASDISEIVKSEISATLESLLSAKSKVEDVTLVSESDFSHKQCVVADCTFEFNGNSSVWKFIIPDTSATQFEYLMLGGMTDRKDTIDDEINDAVKEIVSTITGSIVTSVNAQGYDDISGLKSTMGNSAITECSSVEDVEKGYNFTFSLNDDQFSMVIIFDNTIEPYIKKLTGTQEETTPSSDSSSESSNATSLQGASNILNSILGEESIDNLRLLFDIKMRLSVRLGTKVCLLRDVISWDIGEIIELSQMTNEPLDILVNGVVIGKGEAIIVDGKFGVKIKTLGMKKLNK